MFILTCVLLLIRLHKAYQSSNAPHFVCFVYVKSQPKMLLLSLLMLMLLLLLLTLPFCRFVVAYCWWSWLLVQTNRFENIWRFVLCDLENDNRKDTEDDEKSELMECARVWVGLCACEDEEWSKMCGEGEWGEDPLTKAKLFFFRICLTIPSLRRMSNMHFAWSSAQKHCAIQMACKHFGNVCVCVWLQCKSSFLVF